MHFTQDGRLQPLPDNVLGDRRGLQDWSHGDNSHMQGPHLDSSDSDQSTKDPCPAELEACRDSFL